MNKINKLETFKTSFVAGSYGVVFCLKCGSACVDQNTSIQLACCNCDNSIAFDTKNFGIARIQCVESDVKSALVGYDVIPKTSDSDWRSDIVRANQLFINYVAQITAEIGYERGAPDKPFSHDLIKAKELWEDAKLRTDAIFNSLNNV